MGSTTIPALTAIAAMFAAVASWMAARETRRLSEGQLYYALLADYGTPEMLQALRVLRNWQANNSDEDFAGKWKVLLGAGKPEAHQVDQSRRLVTHFFSRPLRLHRGRYVSKRFLQAICQLDGISVLFNVALPLERALNPAADLAPFERLRKLCRLPGMRLIAPVPVVPEDRRPSRKKTTRAK